MRKKQEKNGKNLAVFEGINRYNPVISGSHKKENKI